MIALELLVALGVAVLVVYAIRACYRRTPVPAVDPMEVYRNTHDWNCDVGAWPHAGRCIAAPEREFSAWIELARCEYVGLGNTVRPDDGETCAGIDNDEMEALLARKGTLLIPRSIAGDWDPSAEPRNPLLPRIEIVDDDYWAGDAR